MNVETIGPLFVAIQISWVLLSAAMLFALLRLVLGPSGPDRVVALDLIATLAVGFIAVDAIANGQPVILDAAIVVSLVAFLGTVAFALYVEKGAGQ